MDKIKGFKIMAVILLLAVGSTFISACSSSRHKAKGSKVNSSSKIGNKKLGRMLRNVD